MNEIKEKMTVLARNIRRLKQCVTCERNPKTCGCDDADEDANGMCVKWAERKEEQ